MSNSIKGAKVLNKISKKGVLVLKTLSEHQDEMKLYGAQIKEATGISSGTLYPVLDRLLGADLIECVKEGTDVCLKRPPRHYYHITYKGITELEKRVSALKKEQRLFLEKSEALEAIIGVDRKVSKAM